jgi:hypothetical protein
MSTVINLLKSITVALTVKYFRSVTFMHWWMWYCMLHWTSVFWYMRKPESLSTETYFWSLQDIIKQKNVFFAQFLEIWEMKLVLQWGVDSQKHYKVETRPGCCVCSCQVYRLPTFCVFLIDLYFISAELCDNRARDKMMIKIDCMGYFFITALSMADLSHRKAASVGSYDSYHAQGNNKRGPLYNRFVILFRHPVSLLKIDALLHSLKHSLTTAEGCGCLHTSPYSYPQWKYSS